MNQHPYRLVILIGCETDGKEWCGAFGIPHETSTVVEYQALGRKPRALVLWQNTILVPTTQAPFGYADFVDHSNLASDLAVLFSNWMGNVPLNVCMQRFQAAALSRAGLGTRPGFDGMESWVIYGCEDLTRNGP
ncbi:MAG: hypothetical protein M2R45_04720 [Verrucomicrobia subdivision 3 bacterium]|nr:hypothetical protein [Limisphaerales bacterium]MCS1416257.1 hypothetical protein [Limisphaerales bacterium]